MQTRDDQTFSFIRETLALVRITHLFMPGSRVK